MAPTMSNESSHSDMEHALLEEADADTIRIMLSTDNHLGYAETDPVRGNDSFAALEEVLYLAKQYGCDMVLLAGDLFHENRPSRSTLHKAMSIFRKYCMGSNPITLQIISDQKKNFRQGQINYQDEFYSVDLPVLSIHGNHDDPSREGSQLYAALDLLDCANLVNYIGRQDEINRVEVSPILIKKGKTHLALYSLGSMRDERLNRMWQSSKVTFLRPNAEESDRTQWFNLFALHQNRDRGRGSKNCIQEAMIPEWMDFVCWGHEHESVVEPQESVVGTFRISQPGSSVATSLVAGEAVTKKVGILDIRGCNFRLKPIPLTQVRQFVIGEVSLKDQAMLDPDDPKVENKIKQLLKEQVQLLVHEARGKVSKLATIARNEGNLILSAPAIPLDNKMEKPNEVLVRLKVEHSGFSVINNQRFGAQFMGEVANSRKKTMTSKPKAKGKGAPVIPDQLEEMNVEDLMCSELEKPEHSVELLDKKRIASALEDYVQKQQAQALSESVSTLLGKKQKILIETSSTEVQSKVGGGPHLRSSLDLRAETPEVSGNSFSDSFHKMDEIDVNSNKRETSRQIHPDDVSYSDETLDEPSCLGLKNVAVDDKSSMRGAPTPNSSRRRTTRKPINYTQGQSKVMVGRPYSKRPRSGATRFLHNENSTEAENVPAQSFAGRSGNDPIRKGPNTLESQIDNEDLSFELGEDWVAAKTDTIT